MDGGFPHVYPAAASADLVLSDHHLSHLDLQTAPPAFMLSVAKYNIDTLTGEGNGRKLMTKFKQTSNFRNWKESLARIEMRKDAALN